MMNENQISLDTEIPVERLRPLLDDALHKLSDVDRRVLLLRYFDGCSMASEPMITGERGWPPDVSARRDPLP